MALPRIMVQHKWSASRVAFLATITAVLTAGGTCATTTTTDTTDTFTADTTVASLSIAAGDTTTVENNAEITVTEDVTIDGTLSATTGRITLFVDGDLIFEANYTSGLRVFDASDPDNPVEIAFFDTRPEGDETDFFGLWGNYPFLPSGTVIGSDEQRGLFVWTIDVRQNQCPNDLDGSGVVDFGDILVVLEAWGQAGGDADLGRRSRVAETVHCRQRLLDRPEGQRAAAVATHGSGAHVVDRLGPASARGEREDQDDENDMGRATTHEDPPSSDEEESPMPDQMSTC